MKLRPITAKYHAQSGTLTIYIRSNADCGGCFFQAINAPNIGQQLGFRRIQYLLVVSPGL